MGTSHQAQLDELTTRVVEAGLAQWAGGDSDSGSLIVRGQSHLLDDISAMGDLERIKSLFEALETKETLLKLLRLADHAQGVQIFIGSDNPLFNVSGCSMVVAPFHDGHQKNCWRHRRDWSNTDQLCAHYSHGRLHFKSNRSFNWLNK